MSSISPFIQSIFNKGNHFVSSALNQATNKTKKHDISNNSEFSIKKSEIELNKTVKNYGNQIAYPSIITVVTMTLNIDPETIKYKDLLKNDPSPQAFISNLRKAANNQIKNRPFAKKWLAKIALNTVLSSKTLSFATKAISGLVEAILQKVIHKVRNKLTTMTKADYINLADQFFGWFKEVLVDFEKTPKTAESFAKILAKHLEKSGGQKEAKKDLFDALISSLSHTLKANPKDSWKASLGLYLTRKALLTLNRQ